MHPMYSGRLQPHGGLPLRRLGPGAVPPPNPGRLQKPLERLLSSAKGMCRMCVPRPPAPMSQCLYETSAPRSVFV